jgi:hypothetical protein
MNSSTGGSCFCGAVTFSVTGRPEVMGYCHCDACRHWSAGPVNGFTLWKPDTLKVTAGAEHVATFNRTERCGRKWCRQCGGHLFSDHPGMGLVDVYAAVLPTLAFVPAFHIHYGETQLRMRDGLPKFKDMPKEVGGTGELMPE